MMLIAQEWIDKAEGDFATASREMCARKNPSYDSVCFHAQQRVKKYMKGRLQGALIPFPRTHDLDQILNLVVTVDPFWSAFQSHFSTLTSYAVRYRYLGQAATREEARDALKQCRAIREYARQSLGLT